MPPGAGDQPLVITVENGASNPASAPRFRYLDAPATSGVAPVPWSDGVVNRSITIEGRNFGTTLHPKPCTLHSTPYTLHPTPYTLHPTPYTPNPTPYTPNPKP